MNVNYFIACHFGTVVAEILLYRTIKVYSILQSQFVLQIR